MYNSKQASMIQASHSRRESFAVQLRKQSQKQYIQENRQQSSILLHGYQKHKENVDKLLGDLTKVNFESDQPFDLLFQLEAHIDRQETRHLDLESIALKIQAFRDLMATKFEDFQKAQFQLLIFHADSILIKLTDVYPKFTVDQILTTLTDQVEQRSIHFLLQNVRNTDLWCSAVVNQNFDLQMEKELLEIVIELIKNPTKIHAWKIILAQPSDKLPFNMEICDIAWSRKKVPEVANLILQKLMFGDQYAGEYLKRGIYEFYKALIQDTVEEKDLDIQIARISVIMESLRTLWENTKETMNPRILEAISEVSLNLFNEESFTLIFHILKTISSNSNYDINSLISENNWFRKIIQILLFQQWSTAITQKTLELMNTWIKDRLQTSCALMLKDIIKSYEDANKVEIERDIEAIDY